MAAVLDTKVLTQHNNVDDPSWAFSPAGVPTLITVCVSKDRVATLDNATYAGVSMSIVIDIANGNKRAVIWKRENPPSGLQTVQLITSSSLFDHTTETIAWRGTPTSDATSGGQSSSGTATSTSTPAVTTGAAGDVVLDTLYHDVTEAVTEGAGQTEEWDAIGLAGANGAGSTEPGAASVTMSFSFPTSQIFLHVAVNIKATSVESILMGQACL